MLRLIKKDRNEHGFAPVSKVVMPLVESLPRELVTVRLVQHTGQGEAALTPLGESLLVAEEWL